MLTSMLLSHIHFETGSATHSGGSVQHLCKGEKYWDKCSLYFPISVQVVTFQEGIHDSSPDRDATDFDLMGIILEVCSLFTMH